MRAYQRLRKPDHEANLEFIKWRRFSPLIPKRVIPPSLKVTKLIQDQIKSNQIYNSASTTVLHPGTEPQNYSSVSSEVFNFFFPSTIVATPTSQEVDIAFDPQEEA
jgi:hypothetical protein